MELNEAAARIFKVHGILILALLVLGLEGGMLVSRLHRDTYTATAHAALVVGDPRTGVVNATAVADTGRAIVTNPTHVRAALDKLGVKRNVQGLIQGGITLRGEGTSGVLALSVRDRDPAVAAGLTNLLTTDMVDTYRKGSGDDIRQLVADLDNQLKALDARIAGANSQFDAANSAVVTAAGQYSPIQFQAAIVLRDGVQHQIDELTSQRNTLVLQRGSLIAAQAFAPRSAVIDPAVKPTVPDSSPAPLDLVLGGLAGLILGIVIAACLETFRPTIVGRFGVARATGSPLLVALSRPPGMLTAADLLILKKGVSLAAAASSVEAVELVAAGPQADLSKMAAHLEDRKKLLVRAFGANGVHRNGHRTGVVVVAPSTLSRAGIADVTNLQAITDWPVLGVVTYLSPAASELSMVGLRRLFDSVWPRGQAAKPEEKEAGQLPREHS